MQLTKPAPSFASHTLATAEPVKFWSLGRLRTDKSVTPAVLPHTARPVVPLAPMRVYWFTVSGILANCLRT